MRFVAVARSLACRSSSAAKVTSLVHRPMPWASTVSDASGPPLDNVSDCRAGEREGDPRYTFAGASAMLVISNLWRIIDEFADLSVHATLAGPAGQLSGFDRLRLYRDAMLYKDSANPASPWHQDEWFRLTDRIVTAWMPFTALEREGGTLIYARASHHQGVADCWNPSGGSGSAMQRPGAGQVELSEHAGCVSPREQLLHGGQR